jgi:hypothetical protein
MGLISILFAGVVGIFKFLLKYPKILLLLIIVGIILFGVLTCANACNRSSANNDQQAGLTPKDGSPAFDKAPFCLYTNTRTYYVAVYTKGKDWIVLQEYYVYQNRHWIKQNQPLQITKLSFPGAKLIQRENNKLLVEY